MHGKWWCLTVLSSVSAIAVSLILLCLWKDPAPAVQLTELPEHLQAWRRRGTFTSVNGRRHFVMAEGLPPRSASSPTSAAAGIENVIVLVHGFPSSSYEFHSVIPLLRAQRPDMPVVAFDHLGYGFSDKPQDDEAANQYSVFDLAENAMALWLQLGIRAAHIVSHDVGNTIVNEILARVHRGSTPDAIGPGFFKSVTFTNGGMIYEHSRPRLMQALLSSRIAPGSWIQRAMWTLDPEASGFKRQLASVWSAKSSVASSVAMRQRDADMADMLLLLRVANGHLIANRLLWYLRERQSYERRWHDALRALPMPCRVVWGGDDAVAPMAIAKALIALTGGHCVLHEVRDAGHFLQLEAPEAWTEAVLAGIPPTTQ